MTVSVRYIVNDVDAAIKFYVEGLDFTLDMHPAPGFAMLSKGELRLLLNKPGAGGGGRAAVDGSMPSPGGWNRFQIETARLVDAVAALEVLGYGFRSKIIEGNGGRQILVNDPSGNPIELFEPEA